MTDAAPLTYTVEQAAARIGPAVTADWLRHNLKRIPHTRSGAGRGRAGKVAFTEAHLAEILQLLERRPVSMPAPDQPGEFTSVVSRGRRVAS